MSLPETSICHGCTTSYRCVSSKAEHPKAFCSAACEDNYSNAAIGALKHDPATMASMVNAILNKCTPE